MKKNNQSEFIKWMGPVLEALKELGGSGKPREVTLLVAKKCNIDEKMLEEKTKTGIPKFYNQVAWARQYLAWEGLLDSSKRGIWTLTEKGYKTSLKIEDSRKIFLKWVAIHAKARKSKSKKEIIEKEQDVDPDSIDNSDYKPNLLEILKKLSPEGFERVCQRLLREHDFESVQVIGKSHDGGIDGIGILELNPFVSFKVIFQCKRYKGTVGSRYVRDFRGAMQGRADKGIIMTTGVFTREAEEEANRDGVPPIELIDGEKLVAMFEKVELGVKPKTVYEVDLGFFKSFLPEQ
jgi:restriction system protein